MLAHADIQARAYHLWEAEGRPHGHHDRHWAEAEALFAAEAMPAKPKRTRAAPKAAGADPVRTEKPRKTPARSPRTSSPRAKKAAP